jgi:ATP-dependent RNA helicase RhlE
VSFKELNLHAKLLRAVEACGFTSPTDIQRQAIPVLLFGSDLMASPRRAQAKPRPSSCRPCNAC